MLSDSSGQEWERRCKKKKLWWKSGLVAIAAVLVIVTVLALTLSLTIGHSDDSSLSDPAAGNFSDTDSADSPSPASTQGYDDIILGTASTLAQTDFNYALPPAPSDDSVYITVQGSDAKLLWWETVAKQFNNTEHYLPGTRTRVYVRNFPTSSRFIKEFKPTIYTPSNMQWITTTESSMNQTLVSDRVEMCCKRTVTVAVGVCMWRSKAEALGWPEANISLADIVEWTNGASWGPKDANWGEFKIGHGNPNASNSGREFITASIYALNKFPPDYALTVEDVWSEKTQKGIADIERSVRHMDLHDRYLLLDLLHGGPQYLDAAIAYEPMVILFNTQPQNGSLPSTKWNDSWVFIFPTDGTYWNEHPFCILDQSDWVQQDERYIEGAKMFLDYVTSCEAVHTAPLTGFRYPGREGDCGHSNTSNSLLELEYGALPDVDEVAVPQLKFQKTAVVAEIQKMWKQNKKAVQVCLGIDVSTSMHLGDNMAEVKSSAKLFIGNLTDRDVIHLVAFNKTVSTVVSGPLERVRQSATDSINALNAMGSGTSLYQALTQCLAYAQQQKIIHGSKAYNYEVLMMLDGNGDDYLDHKVEMDAYINYNNFSIPIYGIIYVTGDDHGFSRSFFEAVADRTQGKMYMADTETLSSVFDEIALYY